jgi:hypothetical protein
MGQYEPPEPKSTGKWDGDDGVCFDSRTAFWCGNQQPVRWETPPRRIAFRFRRPFSFGYFQYKLIRSVDSFAHSIYVFIKKQRTLSLNAINKQLKRYIKLIFSIFLLSWILVILFYIFY